MAALVTTRDGTQPMDTNNGFTKPSDNIDGGWKQIQHKKLSLNNISKERLETMRAMMKQTKVTVVFRVPQDTEDNYSAAETHLNTIRELSKQDSNLVVLDHKGINHVNIHKAFSEEKYKEAFNPREKKTPEWYNPSQRRPPCPLGERKLQQNIINPILKKEPSVHSLQPKRRIRTFHGDRSPIRPPSRTIMERQYRR
jgi:hypothetical protein